MAKQFKDTDIYQEDIYKNLRESLQKTIKAFKQADAAIKKHSQSLASEVSQLNSSAKGVTKLTEANRKSQTLLKEKEAITKKIVKAENELVVVTDLERKTLASLSLEKRRANKLAKEQAILESKVSTQYEKEQVQLQRLQRKLKDLYLTKGKDAKETKKLSAELQRLDKRLKSADAAAGQFQRNVGNYKSALKGAVGGLKNFAMALGVVGGVQLFTRVVRDAFNVVKNFDQAQADLSSVLGVNREDMAALTAQAKELGATTKFTASQVSELQLEYAKLGFTQEEISKVTEATLQLAAAAGTDLATAASVTGSTLRGFGLDASETQRVVDVMAKSFSSSSLDMNKFSTAMSSVAPVAALANKTVEDTTALLGTLTDAGVDAGTAGAGLRNMFLLANKAGLSFDEALLKIKDSTDQTKTAMQLFGTRGAALGVILANSTDKTAELTAKLNDAGGAAGEMADKQLDTLGGALDLLRSAWEGYILGADGAGGASEKLKNIIKFLADNLDTILDTIIQVVKIWGTYKLAMNAATVASNLLGKSLGKMKMAFGAVGIAITLAVKIFQGFKAQWQEANQIQQAWINLQADVNKELDKERAKLFTLRDQLLKTNAASEERQVIIDKINDQYGTTLQNLEDEEAFLVQLEVAYKNYIKQLERRIQIKAVENKLLEANEQLLEAQRRLSMSEGIAAELQQGAIDELKKWINELKQASFWLDQSGEGLDENNDSLTENIDLTDLDTEATKKNTKAKQEQAKKLKKLKESEFDPFKDDKEKDFDPEADFESTRKSLQNNLKQLELDLRRQGLDEEEIQKRLSEEKLRILRLELERKRELYPENHEEIINAELDLQRELDRINGEQEKKEEEGREKSEEKKREQLKKSFQMATDLAKDAADFKIKQIEREQEAAREEIQASQTEQQRLRELGTADAAEALIAEKKREAREKSKIDSLEKRKKDLLITIVALERANQFIQSNEGNPFSKAEADTSKFIKNIQQIPGFKTGTNTTVADALGSPNLPIATDNYLIRAHGNEAIMNAGQYGTISRAFGYKPTTDEMTRSLVMSANRPKYNMTSMRSKEVDLEKAIDRIGKEFSATAKKYFKTTEIHPDLIRVLQGNYEKVTHTKKGFRME